MKCVQSCSNGNDNATNFIRPMANDKRVARAVPLKNDFLPSTAKENRRMPTYNVSKQQYIFYDVFMSTALLSVQA